MVKIFHDVLNRLLLLALLVSACSPQPGVFDIAVAPAAETLPAESDLDALRPLAIVLLAGLPEDRLSFFEYQATACTLAEGLGGPPKCRLGEAEGQVVRVLPIGGPEGSFLRPDEIGQISNIRLEALAGVFRPTPGSTSEPYWPDGDLALVFDAQENGRVTPVVVRTRQGRIVRIDYPAAASAQAVLDATPVETILLSPAQAQAWSEPLRRMQVLSQSTLSEDRRWMAHTMAALPQQSGEPYYYRLSVEGQETPAFWTAVDEWVVFKPNYHVPFPLTWSRDGQALYWTYTPNPEGCRVYVNGSDLHRLDLRTGISTRLVSAEGTWLALSPDEGRAAVIDRDGLSLYSLADGARRQLALPEGHAGQIVWAPDGRSLTLTVAHHACDTDGPRSTSILLVDVVALTAHTLVERDARNLATQDWSLLGMISLAGDDGQIWQLDPQSGELWAGSGVQPRPATAAADPAREIRFFASVGPEDRPVMEAQASEFARLHPEYRVTFTAEPQIDYRHYDANLYLQALNDSCDCFSDGSLPTEFQRRDELLLDLAALAQTDDVRDDFWPGQLDYFVQGGRLYGLPLTVRPEGIGYNADLLQQLGLDAPAADWTFADFLALSEAVAANDQASPLFGFGASDYDLEYLMAGLAGSVLRLDGRSPAANFTAPQVKPAFERLLDLQRSNALFVLPAVVYADADTNRAAQVWQNGQVAMWVSQSGEPPVWDVLDEQPQFRTGFAPLPQLPEDAAWQTRRARWMMAGQNYYILRSSPNQEGCWAWYRFLSESSAQPGIGAYLGLPARRSAALSAVVDAALGEAHAGALRAAVDRFYAAAVNDLDPVERPLRVWLQSAARSVLDGSAVGAVLANVQFKADLYLACVDAARFDGPDTNAVYTQVTNCARQADPQTNW